jgi:hypothetical protein
LSRKGPYLHQKVNERKYAAVTQKSFDITDGGRKGQLPVHLHQFSVQQLVEQTSCLLGAAAVLGGY